MNRREIPGLAHAAHSAGRHLLPEIELLAGEIGVEVRLVSDAWVESDPPTLVGIGIEQSSDGEEWAECISVEAVQGARARDGGLPGLYLLSLDETMRHRPFVTLPHDMTLGARAELLSLAAGD